MRINMLRLRPRGSVAAVATLLSVGALVLTGCGSNSGTASGTSDSEAAASTAASPSGGASPESSAAAGALGAVDVEHYFSGDLGATAFAKIFPACEASAGVTVGDPKIDHEAFKDAILVQLAGGNPPDVFSYWAGAKTQSLVNGGFLAPIDDMWSSAGLDSVIPQSLADSAATYDGQKFLLPFDYHYVGMFYNPAVLAKAGITTMPATWDEMLAAADTLKAAGITPFSLGSKNRWPAQFWFDYILLRTAGPDYRQKLMTGEAMYTDPEVVEALKQWQDLLDKGYFNESPNDIDWTDAADQVAKGEAAMTLMGTWITGYWDGKDLAAGTDYNFFPFPEITAGVPQAALGPVDGWVTTTGATNAAGAQAMLECLAGAEAQGIFAGIQGALPANSTAVVEGQSDVMKAAGQQVADAAAFVFNYDLATPPAVSEVGLNMFQQFIDSPADAEAILADTQEQAAQAFSTIE